MKNLWKNLTHCLDRIYYPIRNFLATHKLIARFFSHGGLHIAVLVVLILVTIYFYRKVSYTNTGYYREVNYTFNVRHANIGGIQINDSVLCDKGIKYHPLINIHKNDTTQKKDTVIIYHAATIYNNKAKNVVKQHEGDTLFYEDSIVSNKVYDRRFKFGDTSLNERLSRAVNTVDRVKCSFYKYNDTIFHRLIMDSNFYDNSFENYFPYAFTNKEGIINAYKAARKYDNPYYRLKIIYNTLRHISKGDDWSYISIRYNDDTSHAAPLLFDKIIPTPTKVTINEIRYEGKEAIDEVLQNGVYLEGTDMEKKARADRMQMLFTVLIGTCITFALDVIVNLILKWRKLKVKK